MTVSRHGALPLYHQLKAFVTERIESGEWSAGRRLPTELEFANEFSVSRTTVRQAMQLLENEGLVERLQGKGTFVGRPKIAQNLASMATLAAWLTSPGSVAELKFHYLETVTASAGVAAKLDLLPGDKAFELQRTVFVNGEPLALLTCWLPAERFAGFEANFSPDRSLRQILRVFYGVKAIRQHKEVEVTILAPEEARLLEANPGAPALLISYLSKTESGEPVELRKMLVRGDRAKYYVEVDSPELLV